MKEGLTRTRHLITVLALALALSACGTNPVTGERELRLISEQDEIEMGRNNYVPTLQAQGGRYYRDQALDDYVSDVSQSLADVSDRPDLPYEFTVINSGVPNAWAMPGGKIAINRGLLLELDDEAQLAAVMGHEIVHSAARHGAQRMQRGMLVNIGVAGIGLGAVLSDNRYAPLIMGGAAIGSQIAMARYSRSHELEADYFGTRYMIEAGYDPQAAVELQKVFVRLSEGQRSDFISGLFQSHPPSQERVEKNQETAREYGQNGRLGRDRYQEMIAGLKEDKDAYEHYDEARRARRDENQEKALELVNRAIAQVEDEAAFYNLRGDIRREQDETDRAMADHNRAVDLYPEMFRYTLSRGLLHRELENWPQAESDLKASLDSVETSIGYLGLGDAVQAQGRRDEARSHYQKAAQDQGEIGDMARRRLDDLS